MRIFGIRISTGRSARKRAEEAAQAEINILRAQRAEEERKRKQEQARAGKIRLNALRSRRSSMFFAEGGSDTIG